jgi:hypothetical protein
VLASGITTQSYTITGIVLGVTYEFTVEVQNALGFSPVSNTATILHALPPLQVPNPQIVNDGQNVIISWDEPEDNGSPITSY